VLSESAGGLGAEVAIEAVDAPHGVELRTGLVRPAAGWPTSVCAVSWDGRDARRLRRVRTAPGRPVRSRSPCLPAEFPVF
jgi:hypothetical protein